MAFLPISPAEIREQGWDSYDFLLVTADAYIDHSSFGAAIISRVLEREGFRVAVLSRPRFDTEKDFSAFPAPRLGVLISCGNLDSMVSNYTAAKKKRSSDVYAPGGHAGGRPDRCGIVYANLARRAFGKDMPIILGGIEPSLRRFAHYDYWDNKVRRSILFDSRASLLIYGMGERQITEIAHALAGGIPVSEITWVAGTAYVTSSPPQDAVFLPSYDEILKDKRAYAEAAKIQYQQQDPVTGRTLAQKHDNRFLIQNPPCMPLSEKELDAVYELPYMRAAHPSYKEEIPAITEILFSITANRGCFGSCRFCSLAFHQGRIVQSRSIESVVREAKLMTEDPRFKGYIHDVGGPTANFMQPSCDKQLKKGLCKNRECLFPGPCPNMRVSHDKYLTMLRALRALPGVKRVFVRSGIRYDYMEKDKNDAFFHELCRHHISGQLRIAPEHIAKNTLFCMGKPGADVYDAFTKKFRKHNDRQYIVPYFMSSHPGCTVDDAVELAVYLQEHKIHPEQVQDFYPTPGTLSTAMFYTGIHPLTGQPVYVPKSEGEKKLQRALLQLYKPENRKTARDGLLKLGRGDLIKKLLGNEDKKDETVKRKRSIGTGKRGTQGRGGRTTGKRH
ncbi:MAG: YgiQ family radical SAM protein [Ruminococcaceae bacterium]|nr:YgiQ family radical SAM protein [Oscillospiraceae bacterium]